MSTNFKITNPSAGSSAPSSAPSSRPASPANGGGFRVPHAPNRPSGLSRTGGFVPHADSSSDEDGAAGPANGSRAQARGGRGNRAQADDDDDGDVVGWDASGSVHRQLAAAAAAAPPRHLAPILTEHPACPPRSALLNQSAPAPVIIAPLDNRDWRNSSRSTAQRSAGGASSATASGARQSIYLPESARAALSGEEVITREVVDTSLQTGGLRIISRERAAEAAAAAGGREGAMDVNGPGGPAAPLTLEQRALRALMAGEEDQEAEDIGAIPVMENARQAPISEEEAFRRDVETRPEEVRPSALSPPPLSHFANFISIRALQSTLDDYARVPVASFGLALLKGMGWKEGQAASRTRTGMTTPYEPKARPALLGIGAKEREQPELKKGEKPKGEWKKRQEAKVYVPVLRREASSSSSAVAGPSSRTDTPASSAVSSRRASRSRSPPSRPSSSVRRRSRERESDRDDRSSSARRDDRYASSSRRDDDRHASSSRRDNDRYSSRRDEREGSSASRRDADRDGGSRRDDRGSSSRRHDDERDYRREREGDDYRRRDERDRDQRRR